MSSTRAISARSARRRATRTPAPAAAGRACTIGEAPDDDTLRATLHDVWGAALVAHVAVCSTRSHGGQVAQRHGAGGARAQAARGFPDVFDIALPALRAARAAGAGVRVARLRALLALMARVDDTNVLYRGGEAGLRLVQQRAREASASADILRASEAMHSELVVRRLSPGGCADLLAAALFVDTLQDAPG